MAKNTFNSIRIENEEHGSRMEKKLCKQMQCSELMSRVNGFCRKFSPVTLVCARERTQQKKICLLKKEVTHTHTLRCRQKREREMSFDASIQSVPIPHSADAMPQLNEMNVYLVSTAQASKTI